MATSLISTFLLWHCVLLQTNVTQPTTSSLRTIAEIVCEPSVFALRPESVREQLASLAPLDATVTTNVLRRYVGFNAGKGIAWVMVDFQPSAKDRQQWTLLQLQICVEGTDAVETTMRSNLTRKLGQPKSDADRVYWDLHEHKEVSLKKGSFEPPGGGSSISGVLVEAAVLQGESE